MTIKREDIYNPLDLKPGSWTELGAFPDELEEVLAVFEAAGANVLPARTVSERPPTSFWVVGWFPGLGVRITTNGEESMRGLTHKVGIVPLLHTFEELIEKEKAGPPAPIQIEDTRPVSDPFAGSIYYLDAQPGKLYETHYGGGVVMAVKVPAVDYVKAFDQDVIFVHPDGRAFPRVSDRIWPLEGYMSWSVVGGGRK